MKIKPIVEDSVNQTALDNPKPGDFWLERCYCPYFIVLQVNGPAITVLSCLGGPNSYSRKDELNARKENKDGTWEFDYSKSMVVDKEWMTKAVKYSSINGFVADVYQTEKNNIIVKEWVEYKTDILIKELKALGGYASQYLLTRDWTT